MTFHSSLDKEKCQSRLHLEVELDQNNSRKTRKERSMRGETIVCKQDSLHGNVD